MWMLRGARRRRWEDRSADDESHVAEAARDLSLRADEDGLSVFEVTNEQDARRVATLLGVHKMLLRGCSEPFDYLLIPPDEFARFGLSIVPVPDPDLGPELSERHREVKGLTADTSRILAATLLREEQFRVNRITRQEIDTATPPGS